MTLDETARRVAAREWADYHARQGIDPPPGEPRIEIVRDDPERAKLGEYLVIVSAGGGADSGGDE
jgi:hypothetical protein